MILLGPVTIHKEITGLVNQNAFVNTCSCLSFSILFVRILYFPLQYQDKYKSREEVWSGEVSRSHRPKEKTRKMAGNRRCENGNTFFTPAQWYKDKHQDVDS